MKVFYSFNFSFLNFFIIFYLFLMSTESFCFRNKAKRFFEYFADIVIGVVERFMKLHGNFFRCNRRTQFYKIVSVLKLQIWRLFPADERWFCMKLIEFYRKNSNFGFRSFSDWSISNSVFIKSVLSVIKLSIILHRFYLF